MDLLTLAIEWRGYAVGAGVVGFLFICVLLILTVLIQRPQGGGLAGAFGSAAGSGQTAFGAKTGDALTIFTIAMFVVYLLVAVGLNYAVKPVAAAPGTPQASQQPANGGTGGAPQTPTPATGPVTGQVPAQPVTATSEDGSPVEIKPITAPQPGFQPTTAPGATPPPPAANPISPSPAAPSPAPTTPAEPKPDQPK